MTPSNRPTRLLDAGETNPAMQALRHRLADGCSLGTSQPRRVSLKPSPELLRCRAGAIPDEQRDGSLPVKLVAVAEASGQRKTRRRGNALRASLWKVLHRIAVRTRAVKAKRGHLASKIIPARGQPCAIPAATWAAQRASKCDTSAHACQARPSRRGQRSRTAPCASGRSCR